MDTGNIDQLLAPFLSESLSEVQLGQISIYIDLLLRWNQRINLTAVRDPTKIITRHFGESFFAAHHLLPRPAATASSADSQRVLDLGSGAGFPGLPMKIWSPHTPTTLIESNHKKVAFLREVVRSLTLTSIDVFPGRAEDYPSTSAGLVIMRAVERFSEVLPAAARLLAPSGRLALLIGSSQVGFAQDKLPAFNWTSPRHIPQSVSRVLLVGIAR
jgi:16S rRNA (guanine527-N7)-methyltransferase